MPDMQQVPNPSGSEKLELSSFCEGVTPKSSDRYFLTSILQKVVVFVPSAERNFPVFQYLDSG